MRERWLSLTQTKVVLYRALNPQLDAVPAATRSSRIRVASYHERGPASHSIRKYNRYDVIACRALHHPCKTVDKSQSIRPDRELPRGGQTLR